MTDESQLQPLPDGVLDKLRQVSTSTIATQLYKRGFRQPQMLGVRPLSNVVDGFVAEAFTMRFIPAREDVNTLDPYRSGNTLQWDAIESVPPGHAIVVDSRGDTSAASGGDMLMTRAWKRGAAAFITDGGLGDGLMGDRDGVIVIPRSLVVELAEPCLEQERIEAFVSTKIHAGEPLWGNY